MRRRTTRLDAVLEALLGAVAAASILFLLAVVHEVWR